MSHISIDVDIDDVIYSMGRWDRKQFFLVMQDNGYISKHCVVTNEGEVQAPAHVERKALAESQDEFNQALQKLWGNGWKLTKEQEDYIINLSKRF
jgi:hypothetical protein